MKVLSGAHQKDRGTIRIDGQPVAINNPDDSKRLGIGIIYQEFSLVPALSVADNIYLDHLDQDSFLVRSKTLNRQAQALLADLGFAIEPRARVLDLSVAHQQVVEIAKALSTTLNVLILDEPTAVLQSLKQQGVTIIYISRIGWRKFPDC
ncbi:MAG: lantibiotic transporter permease [Spirosoma sp.]|nr:lantibiotic transporter permease [Spirosoma sp.]